MNSRVHWTERFPLSKRKMNHELPFEYPFNLLLCIMAGFLVAFHFSSASAPGYSHKNTKRTESFSVKMTLGIMPYRVKYERFAEKHFYLVISPILGRQRLQKHDDTLENASLKI